ncbi:50S ribosomal protein L11 methyltransferase [Nocardiopsis potens]|uniref:50S ribosomal protein L11 methyltransferase n=1 Tax=Nocardiopsis potens TaxID=1246458 RepID=UPI00034D6675|nr:50S ribosomal protein L11 methyltransferase [Nocardiopsis potens]
MLTPETRLYRERELDLRVDSGGSVRLHHQGRVLKLGPETLSVLDALRSPRTVTELLRFCAPRITGARSTELILATASQLVEGGVVRTEPDARFSKGPVYGYDTSYVHQFILNDTIRKPAFVQAVRELVRPDDVVLDLGTGSGILAIAAAQSGARKVYAVEPAGMVHLAEKLAVHNGVADRIEFLQEWSHSLRLPEKATLLTTDIVGNEAMDMLIWETVDDARRRLLTPDARLLPGRLDGLATLVDVPDEAVAAQRIDEAQLDRWRRWYGIDFAPFRDAQQGRSSSFYERPETVGTWTALSGADPLYEVDLSEPPRRLSERRTLTATRAGRANGVVVHFRASLSPSVDFTSSPWTGGPESHWYSCVWLLPEAVPVRPGDQIDIRFDYAGEGRVDLARAGTADSGKAS